MPEPKKHTSISVPHLTAERLQALRDLLPETFSEGKIDFEKLRAALGDILDDSPERYSFSWAGKRDAIPCCKRPPAPRWCHARRRVCLYVLKGNGIKVAIC
jgi:hypothetical protein